VDTLLCINTEEGGYIQKRLHYLLCPPLKWMRRRVTYVFLVCMTQYVQICWNMHLCHRPRSHTPGVIEINWDYEHLSETGLNKAVSQHGDTCYECNDYVFTYVYLSFI